MSQEENITTNELARMIAKGFEQVDKRFEQVDKRFEQVDQKLNKIDQRLDIVEQDLSDIKIKVDHKVSEYQFRELTERVEILEEKVL